MALAPIVADHAHVEALLGVAEGIEGDARVAVATGIEPDRIRAFERKCGQRCGEADDDANGVHRVSPEWAMRYRSHASEPRCIRHRLDSRGRRSSRLTRPLTRCKSIRSRATR